MPPIKIYETLQQTNPNDAYLMNKDVGGRDDLDFFRKDDDVSKKDGQSMMGG
jgi:hypothetical protein